MVALAFVFIIVALVTLGVGLLGASRIRKDRPSLKSYEYLASTSSSSSSLTPMGLDSTSARVASISAAAAKNDADPKKTLSDASHMRQDTTIANGNGDADNEGGSFMKRVCWFLWQLTGIPFLTGDATLHQPPNTTMGNTAAPTRTLLTATINQQPSVEIETVRDSKTALPNVIHAANEVKVEYPSDEFDATEEEGELDIEAVQLPLLLDGVQYYAGIAMVSFATVTHAVDIALFRATSVALRQRRKAHEDAAIHAIGKSYPDIMCLPGHMNTHARSYVSPILKSIENRATTTPRAALSPKACQVETDFLTAA